MIRKGEVMEKHHLVSTMLKGIRCYITAYSDCVIVNISHDDTSKLVQRTTFVPKPPREVIRLWGSP